VLPGSKHAAGDLAWLRARRLDAAIARHAAAGRPVLGVCGGLQLLGEALVDPEGHDGGAGFDGPGLGLLPLVTRYEPDKRVRAGRVRFEPLDGAWAPWSTLAVEGYEIRCGVSVPHPGMAPPRVALRDEAGLAVGWQSGPVLGVYAHGLFESPDALRAMFGRDVPTLDEGFDRMAEVLDAHLDPAWLERVVLGESPADGTSRT
jgi:adenosylcobyric acid synthase